MIHFASPWFLLLLVAVPLLAWLHLRRRTIAVAHPSLALFAGLAVGRSRLARFGGLCLRLLALTLLALALAQPRWPDLRTRLDTDGIAILVVLDTSGSMGETDFDYNGEAISRLAAARRVFRLFVAGSASGEKLPDGSTNPLEGRPGDLVGVVTFATRPEVTCPLTLSHHTLLQVLDSEQARTLPGESETNISDAVTIGLARLRAAGTRRKVLVLLTDGEHNQFAPRSDFSPRQTAQLAASLSIPIYSIDAGSDIALAEADPNGLARTRAVETLRDLASISGGRYFAARDSKALLTACRDIDRLERVLITSYQYRRYHEGCPWLGLSSFVCFVASLALDRTLWRRLP